MTRLIAWVLSKLAPVPLTPLELKKDFDKLPTPKRTR